MEIGAQSPRFQFECECEFVGPAGVGTDVPWLIHPSGLASLASMECRHMEPVPCLAA